MDNWMPYIWMAIIVGWVYICGLTYKINSINRKVKEISGDMVDTIAIENMLKENMEKQVEIEYYEECNIFIPSYVYIKDIDERWALVYDEKDKSNYLIRIDSIKSIKVKSN